MLCSAAAGVTGGAAGEGDTLESLLCFTFIQWSAGGPVDCGGGGGGGCCLVVLLPLTTCCCCCCCCCCCQVEAGELQQLGSSRKQTGLLVKEPGSCWSSFLPAPHFKVMPLFQQSLDCWCVPIQLLSIAQASRLFSHNMACNSREMVGCVAKAAF